MPKWNEGQEVVIIDDTDDPQWPERFETQRATIVDPLGLRSRWVIVHVYGWRRADIRFPKRSLMHAGDYDAMKLEERWEKMDRGEPVPVIPEWAEQT